MTTQANRVARLEEQHIEAARRLSTLEQHLDTESTKRAQSRDFLLTKIGEVAGQINTLAVSVAEMRTQIGGIPVAGMSPACELHREQMVRFEADLKSHKEETGRMMKAMRDDIMAVVAPISDRLWWIVAGVAAWTLILVANFVWEHVTASHKPEQQTEMRQKATP